MGQKEQKCHLLVLAFPEGIEGVWGLVGVVEKDVVLGEDCIVCVLRGFKTMLDELFPCKGKLMVINQSLGCVGDVVKQDVEKVAEFFDLRFIVLVCFVVGIA